jgi:LysM repeat protein
MAPCTAIRSHGGSFFLQSHGYADAPMARRRRSPARFLAPIALVAVIVAGVMVVQNGRSSKSDGTATTTTQSDGKTTTTKSTSTSKSSKKGKSAKTYTVKPGDNLSTVAEKTGVSVERIQALNPKLDAQSLQVGQKIKLSGSGGSTTTP